MITTKIGNFLFRWRSYFPLILLFFGWKVFITPEYLESTSECLQDFFEFFCFSISFLGILIRFIIAGYTPEGTSGRNTKSQIAEKLNTTGFYSIVRHPIYVLSNFLTFLGYLLFTEMLTFILISIIFYFIYYYFIMKAEDCYLESKFGEEWRRWAQITPMIIPKFSNWKPFEGSFNFKKALINVNSTILTTIFIFALIDISRDLLLENEFDFLWFSLLLASILTYIKIKKYCKYC